MNFGWRIFLNFSPTVRLLLVSIGLFNFAFYMLLPFLVTHLHNTIGLAAWVVGLLMGLRNFSQQGLYLFGGYLADRLGHRQVLLAGCLLRSAGFFALAFAKSWWLLAIAVSLSGFSAALYAPAAQSLLSELCADERTHAFSAASVFRAIGELLGPLGGMLLLPIGFEAVGVCSALIFATLFLIIQRALPLSLPSEERTLPAFNSLRSLAYQKDFIWFSLGMSIYFVMVAQLSLLLPLELKRITDSDNVTGWLFACSALIGIALQMPVTTITNKKLPRKRAMAIGFAVMAMAFSPMLIGKLHNSLDTEFNVIASGMLLTLGSLAIHPPMMAIVAEQAPAGFRATTYGLFYFVCAIVVLFFNLILTEAYALLSASGDASLLWGALSVLAALVSVVLWRDATEMPSPISKIN